MNKFKYAFHGLLIGFKDSSIRLQWLLAAAAAVVFAWLRISLIEWILFIICCGLVIAMEYMNTAIETIMDFQHNKYHPQIKVIKDLGAAGVLVAALCAMAVGVLIISRYYSS